VYRIRFHGRGGQGIKTASRILGSAFFHGGFEVQDAPVYGAERRGAPVFAYVRAARSPIRERGVVTHPDLVVVADESLVPIPAADVLQGVTERTVLLINSAAAAEEWSRRLNLAGPIVTLPLSGGIKDRAEFAYVGAACAGAAGRLVGVITRESLAQALRDELRLLGDDVLAANLERALHAYDALRACEAVVDEGATIAAVGYTPPDWIDLAVERPPVAAPDITAPATSVQIKTGAWRSTRPIVERERCHQCTWICSTLCPDSAIHVAADGRPEIDYDHCKGCLICVAVCPHHAIDPVPESPAGRVP
jgi:pyruvate ferredoxin oxidoreductase gamma subunit